MFSLDDVVHVTCILARCVLSASGATESAMFGTLLACSSNYGCTGSSA